jgi:hypothetical protein
VLFVTMAVSTGNKLSAAAAALAYEHRQRAGNTSTFYHRVRLISPHPVPGASGTADLEFTDRDEFQTNHYHTYIRFITTPDGRLFTLQMFIAHDIYRDSGSTESDWQKAVPVAKKVLASVRLG